MVNPESPEHDVFIEEEEHEKEDDPSETSTWTKQREKNIVNRNSRK